LNISPDWRWSRHEAPPPALFACLREGLDPLARRPAGLEDRLAALCLRSDPLAHHAARWWRRGAEEQGKEGDKDEKDD